ncbi:cell surface glycoprotein 1-like [Helianthus annuus]|uniref:cell surface glycoprotein 1-like n=1 Tax=Helianthus annuus TaxID=4232 RepID=UPI000B8FFF84|nr:cell surface glycoprotein 1-like [Helianthus annuus]
MSSSSRVSDPVAVDSDDPMYTDSEVHTSDTDSTDEDAFQPFAIPDLGDDIPHADGVPAGDLPLVEIPAPVPHATFPAEDLPHDVESDDDLVLFEGPPEDHHEGGAQIDEEAHSDSSIPDSPESVASSVPPPIHADIPAEPDVVAPFPDPVPLEPDHALFAAHVDPQYADTRNGWIDDDDELPPFVAPVAPVLAPIFAPTDIPPFPPHTTDAPLFPTHTTEAHRTDLPITFLQEIPPPRPGEGPSHQPFGHAPFLTGGDQFAPQIPHHTAVPPVPPFPVPPFTPSSEPFLWTTSSIMPPTDPYHPYYVGPSTEDVLVSFMLQHDALTRRVQVLEQQIECLSRSHHAMEEDWLLMRSLFYFHFPPPPPAA